LFQSRTFGRVADRRGTTGQVCRDRLLRDWLDAYRYFDVPLFGDDPAAMKLVMKFCAASPA
jgi:hypothetical protein